MIIPQFQAFTGQHCETVAIGSLLQQQGIRLSEPMLFGLGEGLGFIFWNMKNMDFPFIGGRIKPDLLSQNLCRNLGLQIDMRETASQQKAWKYVKEYLDQNMPVGLKLDCYHLDYFTQKFHFAAHYVAIYGYDDQKAYLVDTRQQGGMVSTSLHNLALARSEKGPMSSKNLYYVIRELKHEPDLEAAIRTSLVNNANDYLNPPIKNMGYKGIIKTSEELKKWFARSSNREHEFTLTSVLMERGGTGGALFRNLYRDFLAECHALLGCDELEDAHAMMARAARDWNKVSYLLHKAGETGNEAYIDEASERLLLIANKEKSAMEALANIKLLKQVAL